MSFTVRESIDVDMWTGIGIGSFACFNPQTGVCPSRSGHCCIAFIEIMCCGDGTHTAALLGVVAFDGHADAPLKDSVLGSFWMPSAWAAAHSLPLPYGWADQTQPLVSGTQEYNHRMAPASIVEVPLLGLPGLPEDDTTTPPTPAHVTLPVTDPATLPEGCTLSYVAISSNEWIDVIQSDGSGGYKTNCAMGCKQESPPA